MGHQRLGRLPATKAWNAVVALITGGADAADIASAVGRVTEDSLANAADDPALRQGFWLLTQIPLAAREADFGAALRALGLEVSRQPTLIEIGASVMAALDRVTATDTRASDLSEIAAVATVESLVAVAGRQGPSLFGNAYQADEARTSLAGLASPAHFAVLARDFFARLTHGYLGYYLSRVLPDQVGTARRFQSIQDHSTFEAALQTHCREASYIIEAFSAEWFSKTVFQSGITRSKAGGFAHVAFQKMRDELQMRSGSDANA
jgi:hypothetical protein